MTKIPDIVRTAWTNRDGPIVFATVDRAGVPNAIYASSVQEYAPGVFVVADNYFNKTRANILAGSRGALLFLTKARKSYQLKGRIDYHTSGPVFDAMKRTNRSDLPGIAAAALHVEQVYCGGEQLA